MNRTRLLMIGTIALILGFVASYQVYRTLNARAAAPTAPGAEVVVAADDLPVGAKIEDRDVKLVRFPSTDLPANHFRAKAQVIGRGVILPISKGEFVLASKLAGENAGAGLPALIPPGMRAVSVRVNEVVSVAGFVQPGTRVDVMLTGNPTGAGEQQTTTVLENVLVLATGQRLERNGTGESQVAPVITLQVSPEDAQRLTLASSQGHIQLALRNPMDTKQQDLQGAKTASLYKESMAPAGPVHPKVKHTAVAPPPPPAPYQIEVIRGDKKDVTKF